MDPNTERLKKGDRVTLSLAHRTSRTRKQNESRLGTIVSVIGQRVGVWWDGNKRPSCSLHKTFVRRATG